MTAATPPEILRTSLLSAVLHLKSLPLQVDVLQFDFLDRPSVRHLDRVSFLICVCHLSVRFQQPAAAGRCAANSTFWIALCACHWVVFDSARTVRAKAPEDLPLQSIVGVGPRMR